MKFKGIIVAILIALAISCFTSADQPVPAVPETQGLVTTTGADVVGMATEMDAGAWTLTNSGQTMYILTMPDGNIGEPVNQGMLDQLTAAGGSYILIPGMMWASSLTIPESLLSQQLSGAPSGTTWEDLIEVLESAHWIKTIAQGGIHTGALNPGQIQYTTAYDASILAQSGHTFLSKSMNINTGNKVAATQSNLKATTLLTYIATSDAGNVVGSENLLIDGAGNTTSASDRMLCPFASQPVDVIPAYCNIVQTGNSYDLTVGSVTSTMGDRFVGTDATIPVQLDHEFNVKPYSTTEGSIPAIGSTSAYIRAHIQEARGWNNITYEYIGNHGAFGQGDPYTLPGTPLKAEDLQYSETSSASGVIQQFSKVIHYQSGKSLMP